VRSPEFVFAVAVVAFAVLIMFFLQPIAQAAMVHAVSETILGHETGFLKSFYAIQPKIGRLIAAYFLYVIIITVVFSPFIVVVSMALIDISSFASDRGMIIAVIAMLLFPPSFAFLMFLSIKYLFIPHAMVLDNTGVMDSLRRSFRLSTGYWWRVLGVYVVISFIVSIIASLLGGAVNLLDMGLNYAKAPVSVTVSVSGAILATLTLLISPVSHIATTLIYYDLRIRKEGFDVILLASSIMGGAKKPDDPDELIPIG